ncbi:HD-GYP domain-containing protein [Neobacillus sp. LXY-4]|uniref:HD-GYP domain-containing protein n=1 Tax=Neobacillus sp. LXY-4 TaxID=3379826 RepID=UPI003EE191C8
MQKIITGASLIKEEKRTIKWFLSLFYIIFVGYDLIYYYIFPNFVTNTYKELPTKFGYWIYVLLAVLLPIALYLIKTRKQSYVKYVLFIGYTLIIIASDLYTYIGTDLKYASGNPAEIFIVLFSPIFVNYRYFWTVVIGTVLKYLLIGFALSRTDVFIPILLVGVIAIVAYIFVNRFTGYVRAIEDSFDRQLQGIVKGVIATLELKDPYTRGHSQRVASYALAMAKEFGKFSKEELREFNYACLLHDVGKINIPDRILMKPEKLTNEEYEIIKIHPSIGAKTVEGVEGLKNGIDVIRSHHERWDGKGYPDNLIGEEIPILARITSIADAFDAMTSSRSYRAALPLTEAYKRILEGKGTQFDPNLVELFKKVFPKWEELHNGYKFTSREEVN